MAWVKSTCSELIKGLIQTNRLCLLNEHNFLNFQHTTETLPEEVPQLKWNSLFSKLTNKIPDHVMNKFTNLSFSSRPWDWSRGSERGFKISLGLLAIWLVLSATLAPILNNLCFCTIDFQCLRAADSQVVEKMKINHYIAIWKPNSLKRITNDTKQQHSFFDVVQIKEIDLTQAALMFFRVELGSGKMFTFLQPYISLQLPNPF